MAAKKKYALMQKLQILQSSFNLQTNNLTQRKAKILVIKLKREFECNEYDHPEEKKRYYNLITYLHYFLRNVEEAKQCNEMALKMEPESIVALGNQVWINYREHDHSEDFENVEQILKKVDELCTDRVRLAVAKSEMAYSYARFGMSYYARAESIYEEVLNDVKCKDKLPVFLWQYGCGLIKNRLLRECEIRDDTEKKDNIKRAASLLCQVANQDENLRFKARASTELGNLAVWVETIAKRMEDFCPIEPATDMFLKAINILLDNNILDIHVLEQYANHCRRLHNTDLSEKLLFMTIEVNESPRACNLLAGMRKEQMMEKLQRNRIPDNDESKEILNLYNSAIATSALPALGFKGQFLMQMGKIEEAIKVFEEVYRSLEQTDAQQEELGWKTKAFCQTCHAKCLLGFPRDAETITRAKELLWSAIELCFDVRTKSQKQTEILKHPVNEMLKLLAKGDKTTESVLEEAVMCELVGKKVQADKLPGKIEIKEMSTVQPPKMARRLIKVRQFNEGLFLLKQMLVSNTLPEEMKEFAIAAHIDGANDALEKGDTIVAGRRALFAFDIRFPNENSYITRERLHAFFLANECKKKLTQSVQDCLTNWTNLDIATCFDAMPGSLRFSSLEENMHQSSVLAILFDENDIKNDDYDSRLFQISVEIAQLVHMTHGKEKALIVITVSDQSDAGIPDRLRHVPCLPLGKLFQENKKKWVHEFFLRALLK